MGDKTKIEWAEATWNPVTGCLHGCEYCYAQRIAERFNGHFGVGGLHELTEPIRDAWRDDDTGELVMGRKEPYPYGFTPTLHRYRLDIPASWTKPRTIFVCSMADLFGRWVPVKWIVDVLDACAAAPQHCYLFLTKNGERYWELDHLGLLPHGANFWYGTSVNYGLAARPPLPSENGDMVKTFCSIEPIHGRVRIGKGADRPDWVIVGAETGNRRDKVRPRKEWIDSIVEQCDASGVPVLMKDSLIPIVGAENMRRDFPWEQEARNEKA